MLIAFVVLYLLASVAIGLFAAKRVKNTADYAVAGRSLALPVVIATTFATWFGAETVLGVSARFVSGGLGAVVEDPFGASMCLVFVGLFFAYKLYQKNLITLGDYYRQRYGRTIEILCSVMIILSYLGWVAAQITALGLVFSLLSNGAISMPFGMVIGTSIVLVYTLFGGMWSVALTDFVQMIVIGIGLIAIAWFAADLAGGAGKVIDYAAREGKFQFFPTGGAKEWIFFFAAAITMMLGSIPQQDVFQRVMSSNSAQTAVRGPVIGGTLYLLFALIPMFVVTAAVLVMGDEARALLKDDPQKVLPTLVMGHMPVVLQVAFFGALLSAIMSTASATLLAPSTTFVENILRNMRPGMSDKATLQGHAPFGAGRHGRRAGLRHLDAGHLHLRAGVRRLPGALGRGVCAARVRAVLEAGDDAGGPGLGGAGPGHLAGVRGHPGLVGGLPPATGRRHRRAGGNGGGFAPAAEGDGSQGARAPFRGQHRLLSDCPCGRGGRATWRQSRGSGSRRPAAVDFHPAAYN